MEISYLLEVDETYRINGTRSFYEYEDEQEAIESYHAHRRGMVNILKIITYSDGTKSKKLHQDEDGRKYIKGSPFYGFPHVPHRSAIDGTEIPTT